MARKGFSRGSSDGGQGLNTNRDSLTWCTNLCHVIGRLVSSQLSVSVLAKQRHTSHFADHKKLVFFATQRGTILSLVAIKSFSSEGIDAVQT